MKKDNAPKRVAILGCFRSGTNFAKTLLEQNFNCEIKNNVFGWKHGYVPIISNDSNAECRFHYDEAFFITKNPFSFLFSLFNYHKEVQRNIIAPLDFESFIFNKIVMFDESQDHSPQLRFSSPVELWNNMNWNYYSSNKFVHVRYEKLIEKPELVCEKLALKMGLVRNSESFFIPDKRVKRINDGEKLLTKNDYMSDEIFNNSNYTSHKYMKLFNQRSIEFVLNKIDDELLKMLGYVEIVSDVVNLTNE